jgi:hypothetical protein
MMISFFNRLDARSNSHWTPPVQNLEVMGCFESCDVVPADPPALGAAWEWARRLAEGAPEVSKTGDRPRTFHRTVDSMARRRAALCRHRPGDPLS